MKTNTLSNTHISLYVSDLKKTVAFYNDFFGQPADKIKPGYAKYMLSNPPLVISFLENPERTRAGFGHLGIQVSDKEILQQWLETAKAVGMPVREEEKTACCYAVQDKFWVNDPDGVEWEVYYFHSDTEVNDPQHENAEAAACCIAPATPPALQETCDSGACTC